MLPSKTIRFEPIKETEVVLGNPRFFCAYNNLVQAYQSAAEAVDGRNRDDNQG